MKPFTPNRIFPKNQSNKDGKTQKDILKKLEAESFTSKSQSKRYSLSRSKSCADSIKYLKMFEDGICLVEKGIFTKAIKFSDVNYQKAKEEYQEAIFNQWCNFYNSVSSGSYLQLLLVNRSVNPDFFQQNMLIKKIPENEVYNEYVDEFNDVLLGKALEGDNSIAREKYVIYGVYAEDLRDARYKLARVESEIKDKLKAIGSSTRVLNGFERLEIINWFNRENPLQLRYNELFTNNLTTRDYVAPSSFDFGENRSYYRYGSKYGQTVILRDLPLELQDDVLKKITDLPLNLAVSVHISLIDHSKALEMVNKKIGLMNMQKSDDLKRASTKGYSAELLPEDLDVKKNDAEILLEDLRDNEQNFFKATILIWTTGDSLEELTANLFKIIKECREAAFCAPETIEFQQENALNSVYPLGYNRIKQGRHLTTVSLGIFMPFTTQDLFDVGGLYYGQNQLSNNMIFVNRKNFKAPNGWILGMPGGGKSFAAKREIINALLSTGDEIIVIDPEEEYLKLAENFSGEIVELSPDSKTYINPFDLNMFSAGDKDNPLQFKIDFLFSFVEMLAGEITAERKSIIDRCIRLTYRNYILSEGKEKMPTFKDFYESLLQQPEQEARNLAVELEIYIEGTLNIFSHETNVDVHKRFVVYDVNKLGQHLKSVGMLIVLDQVWNRIVRNNQQGVRTWVYIDEIQLLFQNEYSTNYFDELWSRARKWGAIPTGITQNVERLLKNEKARLMLFNSEFILMLKQSPGDGDELKNLLKLSDEQIKYVEGKIEEGSGLLSAAGAIIPFKDKFDNTTNLYRLMTTKPGE